MRNQDRKGIAAIEGNIYRLLPFLSYNRLGLRLMAAARGGNYDASIG